MVGSVSRAGGPVGGACVRWSATSVPEPGMRARPSIHAARARRAASGLLAGVAGICRARCTRLPARWQRVRARRRQETRRSGRGAEDASRHRACGRRWIGALRRSLSSQRTNRNRKGSRHESPVPTRRGRLDRAAARRGHRTRERVRRRRASAAHDELRRAGARHALPGRRPLRPARRRVRRPGLDEPRHAAARPRRAGHHRSRGESQRPVRGTGHGPARAGDRALVPPARRGLAAGKLLDVAARAQHDAPAAGSRIAATGAVGERLDVRH